MTAVEPVAFGHVGLSVYELKAPDPEIPRTPLTGTPASFKPNLGMEQANFERRLIPEGLWLGNGHLNILP